MGKYLKYLLGPEIRANCKVTLMSDLAQDILMKCDDLNAVEAASSSGKYHPIADLGKGGLIRHSLMVAECTMIMIRSIPKYDNKIDHDVMYLSAILHDLCKYTTPAEKDAPLHTNFDHPTLMAKLIEDTVLPRLKILHEENIWMCENSYAEVVSAWNRIINNISCHMSRWNTNEKYAPGVELPLPTGMENYILSFADLIASNAQLPEKMAFFKDEAVQYLTGRKTYPLERNEDDEEEGEKASTESK